MPKDRRGWHTSKRIIPKDRRGSHTSKRISQENGAPSSISPSRLLPIISRMVISVDAGKREGEGKDLLLFRIGRPKKGSKIRVRAKNHLHGKGIMKSKSVRTLVGGRTFAERSGVMVAMTTMAEQLCGRGSLSLGL